MFAELVEVGFTGHLQLSTRKTLRRVFFVEGAAVGFWSDHPEDAFGRRFVDAGYLDSKALRWAQQHLSNGERIEEALVDGVSVTWEQVSEQQVRHIESGLDTLVRMKSGAWELRPSPQLSSRVQLDALPQARLHHSLWKGVRKSVSADKAVQELAAGGGAFRCANSLSSICEELQQIPEGLEDGLRSGSTLEQLFEQVRDPAGELFQLVWFLESAGAVSRLGGATRTLLFDEEAQESPTHKVYRPSKKAPPVPPKVEQVEEPAEALEKGEDVPLDEWEEKEVPDNSEMSLERADELMNIGAFAAALSFLEDARLAEPNNPDVLAALGWAHFQATGGDDFQEAEDFVDLALTFDETNLKALEYRGRLSIEKGEVDRARTVVEKLADLDPKNRWARAQMRQLGAAQDTKRGFGFWRRK